MAQSWDEARTGQAKSANAWAKMNASFPASYDHWSDSVSCHWSWQRSWPSLPIRIDYENSSENSPLHLLKPSNFQVLSWNAWRSCGVRRDQRRVVQQCEAVAAWNRCELRECAEDSWYGYSQLFLITSLGSVLEWWALLVREGVAAEPFLARVVY